MTVASGRGPGVRGALLLAAKMVLSVGLMAFLFTRIPAGSFLGAVRAADPRWLVAAGALMLFSNLLGSWQ